MLMHADRYGLKWVFVRDPYYDPLLYFAGWRPVDYLEDKTITVWSKDGRAAGHARECGADAAALARSDVGNSSIWQAASWPLLVFLIPERRRQEIATEYPAGDPSLAGRRLVS